MMSIVFEEELILWQTSFSLHLSLLLSHSSAAPWLFHTTASTASGVKVLWIFLSMLLQAWWKPQVQFPHTPRTGDAEVAQVEQGRDILFLTSGQSCPRLVASFCSGLWGLLPTASTPAWGEGAACLLQQPQLAQLARAALGDTGWQPASCRATAACHHPAPRAGLGCCSASAGFWARHGSSETSQTGLGAQGCPRAEEASSHIVGSWAGSHHSSSGRQSRALKFPCAPCPLSQPR